MGVLLTKDVHVTKLSELLARRSPSANPRMKCDAYATLAIFCQILPAGCEANAGQHDSVWRQLGRLKGG
jgi:hypothetical protein